MLLCILGTPGNPSTLHIIKRAANTIDCGPPNNRISMDTKGLAVDYEICSSKSIQQFIDGDDDEDHHLKLLWIKQIIHLIFSDI